MGCHLKELPPRPPSPVLMGCLGTCCYLCPIQTPATLPGMGWEGPETCRGASAGATWHFPSPAQLCAWHWHGSDSRFLGGPQPLEKGNGCGSLKRQPSEQWGLWRRLPPHAVPLLTPGNTGRGDILGIGWRKEGATGGLHPKAGPDLEFSTLKYYFVIESQITYTPL